MKANQFSYIAGILLMQISALGFGQSRNPGTVKDTIPKQPVRTLNEVTISAGSFEASDKAKGASLFIAANALAMRFAFGKCGGSGRWQVFLFMSSI